MNIILNRNTIITVNKYFVNQEYTKYHRDEMINDILS